MRTAKRKTLRLWCFDLLVGMSLGFVGALLLPRRRAMGERAAPPTPRPLDVLIEAPYEEPSRGRWHKAA